jgi:hypothetical protein
LRELLRQLDAYFFAYGSATTMGLLRILVGSVAVVALAILVAQSGDWFTEAGFVPAEVGRAWLGTNPLVSGSPVVVPRIALLSGVEDPGLVLGFLLLTLLAAVLTTFGLWTRTSSILLAIGLVSIHHRNPLILHGGDTVLRVAVLYLAIGPSGKALSLDRLIGLWRGRIPPGPALVSLWPQRLVCYNVALLYFTTVWLKYFGHLWRDGTATWYPARLDEFQRFPVPAFIHEMPWVRFTTYGTLFVEFALATLVFYRPLRKWVLGAGVLMHGFIEYSMNIPLFSFTIVSLYVCFYEGEEVSAWARRVGERLRRWRVTLRRPVGTRLRPGAAAYLQAVDPLGLVEIAPGEGAAWSAEGSRLPPSLALWTRSPGAWFSAWFPGQLRRMLDRATEPATADPPVERAGKKGAARKG